MGQAEITAIVYTTFHAVRVFEEMRQRLPDKKSHKTDVSWLFDTWRRGWDSNPCAIARKLISSQPRYDHFDTSPYDSSSGITTNCLNSIQQISLPVKENLSFFPQDSPHAFNSKRADNMFNPAGIRFRCHSVKGKHCH